MKGWTPTGVAYRTPTVPDSRVIDPVRQLARPLGATVRATDAEMQAAVRTVLRNARNNADALLLLRILGLAP